jgi:vanillate O-demethylase ferredoxin subunit
VTVPADKGILDVLRSMDVAIDTNCEQGVCGTCICNVVDGTPDHRDQYLSANEKTLNVQMLPCVSRSKSATLVLDL